MVEITELSPAGVDREITAPEQPADAHGVETGLQHSAVHAASREVHEDVRQVPHGVQRVDPVAAPADVRENEAHRPVPGRQTAQLHGVGCFLPRDVAATPLPDMMQDRHAALTCQRGDRIEQRIVRAPARGQLDPDEPGRKPTTNLRFGVRGKVGVHGHVPTHTAGVLAAERRQGFVRVGEIGRRGEVRGRRPSPRAENRGDVISDTDAFARREPAGVALAPVGPGRALGIEMRVDVDQHRRKIRQPVRSARTSPSTPRVRSTTAASWAADTKL